VRKKREYPVETEKRLDVYIIYVPLLNGHYRQEKWVIVLDDLHFLPMVIQQETGRELNLGL
jgi:hypothetical protein